MRERNLDIYGDAPIPWSRALEQLESGTATTPCGTVGGTGWPARATAGALTAEYSAPSAGPPPWYLYAVTPATAFGVAMAEPYGAMRWQLEE
jgi:hypothetical protein